MLLLCLQPLRFLQPLQPGLLLLPFLLLLLVLLGFSGGSNPCVGLPLDLGFLAAASADVSLGASTFPGFCGACLAKTSLGGGALLVAWLELFFFVFSGSGRNQLQMLRTCVFMNLRSPSSSSDCTSISLAPVSL